MRDIILKYRISVSIGHRNTCIHILIIYTLIILKFFLDQSKMQWASESEHINIHCLLAIDLRCPLLIISFRIVILYLYRAAICTENSCLFVVSTHNRQA